MDILKLSIYDNYRPLVVIIASTYSRKSISKIGEPCRMPVFTAVIGCTWPSKASRIFRLL